MTTESSKKKIGLYLKNKREAKGIDQQVAATALGIFRERIYQIESGKFDSISQINEYANYLGITNFISRLVR